MDTDTRNSQEVRNRERFEDFERRERIKQLSRQSVQIANKLHLQNKVLYKGEGDDQQLEPLVSDSESDSLEGGTPAPTDIPALDLDEGPLCAESSGALAASLAAEKLVERQRAALGRIEESVSVQPSASGGRPREARGVDGAARAAALAGLSLAERRMAKASDEICRRRQREEQVRQFRARAAELLWQEGQDLYQLGQERIEACGTRRQDQLYQATHSRAQAAHRRRNQMLRARRELERDEVRQVGRRAEAFKEKLQRAAQRREERSASPPKKVAGRRGSEGGGSFTDLLGSSHSLYRETLLQWQQRELELNARARAQMREALGGPRQVSGAPDKLPRSGGPSRQASGAPDSLGGPARQKPLTPDACRRGGERGRAERRLAARDASLRELPVCGPAARAGPMHRSASAAAPVRPAAAARGQAPVSLPSLA